MNQHPRPGNDPRHYSSHEEELALRHAVCRVRRVRVVASCAAFVIGFTLAFISVDTSFLATIGRLFLR
jgi:hypothetical protein